MLQLDPALPAMHRGPTPRFVAAVAEEDILDYLGDKLPEDASLEQALKQLPAHEHDGTTFYKAEDLDAVDLDALPSPEPQIPSADSSITTARTRRARRRRPLLQQFLVETNEQETDNGVELEDVDDALASLLGEDADVGTNGPSALEAIFETLPVYDVVPLPLDEKGITDKALAIRAKEGDREAYGLLCRRHSSRFHGLAYRVLGNAHDAANAVQDAYLAGFRSIGRYEPSVASFSTWMYRIVKNKAIDIIRKKRRYLLGSEDDAGLADVVDSGDRVDSKYGKARLALQLHEALESLPPMYREVLQMYHFEHLKYKEIADALGIPMGTVMNRIYRARRKLCEVLEEISPTAREEHSYLYGVVARG